MKKVYLISMILFLILAGCQSGPGPKEVVTEFENDLNAGDVEAAFALFADDAQVVFTPDDITSGAEQIHAWLEQLIAFNFEIEYDNMEENGEKLTAQTTSWSDFSRQLDVAPLIADEVYTIRDGKITELTITLTDESEAKLGVALSSQPSAVVAAFEQALNTADVKAAFALFADDAQVIFTPEDKYTGAEQIHAWLEQLIAFNFEIEYDVLEENGEQLTAQTTSWSDFSRQLDVAPLIADEVYTIRDGKIVELTITLTDESEAKLGAALASQPSAVVMSLAEAINAANLEAAMAVFADNFYFENNPALKPGFPLIAGGNQDMRAWLDEMISNNTQLETEIISEVYDTATTKTKTSSDYLRSLGAESTVLTEVITVQDGKIKSHKTSIPETSLNELQESMAQSGVHETIAAEPGEVILSTTSALVGKWLGYLGGEPGYVIFDPGGSYKITEDTGQVGDQGHYWFEDQLLLMEAGAPHWYCDKSYGSFVVYTDSSTSQPDQLRFHKILDLCSLRWGILTETPLSLEK